MVKSKRIISFALETFLTKIVFPSFSHNFLPKLQAESLPSRGKLILQNNCSETKHKKLRFIPNDAKVNGRNLQKSRFAITLLLSKWLFSQFTGCIYSIKVSVDTFLFIEENSLAELWPMFFGHQVQLNKADTKCEQSWFWRQFILRFFQQYPRSPTSKSKLTTIHSWKSKIVQN